LTTRTNKVHKKDEKGVSFFWEMGGPSKKGRGNVGGVHGNGKTKKAKNG